MAQKRKKPRITMLQYVWKHAEGFRGILVLLLVLAIVESALAAFSIGMVLPITSEAVSEGSELPRIFDWLVGWISKDLSMLFLVLGVFLLIKAIVLTTRMVLTVFFIERLRLNWQSRLLQQYLYQPFSMVGTVKMGDLNANLIRETDKGSMFLDRYLAYLAQLFVVGALIAMLFLVNWKVALASLIVGSVLWYLLGRSYFRMSVRLGKEAQRLNRSLQSLLLQSLQTIREIKLFTQEDWRYRGIFEEAQKVRSNKMRVKLWKQAPKIVVESFVAIAVLALTGLVFGREDVFRSYLPLIVYYGVTAEQILRRLTNLGSMSFSVRGRLPSFQFVVETVFGTPVAREELDKGKACPQWKRDICFEDVSFRFAEGAELVVREANLTLRKGETVGLVGPSGSGKTTLVNLLARLYEPTSGRILMDGTPIAEFSLRSWRRSLGFIPQNALLTAGTIRENICLDREDVDEEQLRRICHLAMVDEFLDDLPQGAETVIGELSSGLSGGQERRIMLARGLAVGASLFILDETTGALPEETEAELFRRLRTLPELSMIMITHRASSLALCDRVYGIRRGIVQPLESFDEAFLVTEPSPEDGAPKQTAKERDLWLRR